jgi:hypothetical protein
MDHAIPLLVKDNVEAIGFHPACLETGRGR